MQPIGRANGARRSSRLALQHATKNGRIEIFFSNLKSTSKGIHRAPYEICRFENKPWGAITVRQFDQVAVWRGQGLQVTWGRNQLGEKIHSGNTGSHRDLSTSGINYDPMKDLYVIGQVPEPVTSLPFGPRKEGQFQERANEASVHGRRQVISDGVRDL